MMWRRWMSVSLLVVVGWLGTSEAWAEKVLLLTDAKEDDPVVLSLDALYPTERMMMDHLPEMADANGKRIIVFFRKASVSDQTLRHLAGCVRSGAKVVMDLEVFARWQGLSVGEEVAQASTVMHIAVEDPATRGFLKGDRLPWFGYPEVGLRQRFLIGQSDDMRVLARNDAGAAVLAVVRHGDGVALATDLTGLTEPQHNQPGSFNKYLFLGNLLGGSVRYGRHFNERLTYDAFVMQMRSLADRYPVIRLVQEGEDLQGRPIYSLNLGDAKKPAFVVYAAAHGGEWEPAYGLLTLAEWMARDEKSAAGRFDFGRFHLVIAPLLNPTGYEAFRRQNARGVDLNRNMEVAWAEYTGRAAASGVYGPGSYDWKGEAPFSEPESQAFRAMLQRVDGFAYLDFHGNRGDDTRLAVLPHMADRSFRYENERLAREAMDRFNTAFAGRYVLREARQEMVNQYRHRSFWNDQLPRPTMGAYAGSLGMRGMLLEVPAMYRGVHSLVFNTDLVVETSLAFFEVYGAPQTVADVPPYVSLADFQPARRMSATAGEPNPAFAFPQGRAWGRMGPVEFVVYAQAGETVQLTVRHRDLTARREGEPANLQVHDSHGAVMLQESLPFHQPVNVRFSVTRTGLHRLRFDLDVRGIATVETSSHPVNLHSEDQRLLLRINQGAYFFGVPRGTSAFAVRVSGRHGSGIRALLVRPDGQVHEDSGSVGLHAFSVLGADAEAGGVWELRVLRPEGLPGENLFVELLGIPPLLAPSSEAVLAGDRSRHDLSRGQ